MKILINRTDAIGDTLLSIPLGRLIKYFHPEAKLGLIVSPRSAKLIELCEGIDQVFTLETKVNRSQKWQQCKSFFEEFSPDYYFHMGGDFTPSAYAYFKRVPFRGGLVSKIPSFLFLNRGVRQSRSQVLKHESEYNMDLAAPMGIFWNQELKQQHSDELAPVFKMDKTLQEEIRKDRFHYEGRKLIFIHPGMSGHTLNWPNECYGQLANLLDQEFGDSHKIIISFTPGDLRYVEGMKAAMNKHTLENAIFFDGSQKGLVDFTYALSLADLFIGPSTGTTHMANALGLKQVALYSPIKVQSVKRWGPFYRNQKVVVFSPTPDNVDKWGVDKSMASISVDEVFQCCRRLISNEG